MTLSPIVFAAFPILSTFIGGYVVLRWKRDLHPWLSLSGGILLGVAFLDLLPEAIDHGMKNGLSAQTVLTGALLAILAFHLLDKIFSVHAHHDHASGEPAEPCDNEYHRTKGWIRASCMILHSFFDGLAIGGGFAIDPKLGALITLAVVMHDFSDGMSTVTILKHALGAAHRGILPMLALDALAPFVGSFVGVALAPRQEIIAIMLSVFSGFFIFLALSELLPQAHAGKFSRNMGIFLTVLGIASVAVLRSIADV